jgi:hypothetical protein
MTEPRVRPRASIGEILVLRADFEAHARNPDVPLGLVARAETFIDLLDELIGYREQEGVNAKEAVNKEG